MNQKSLTLRWTNELSKNYNRKRQSMAITIIKIQPSKYCKLIEIVKCQISTIHPRDVHVQCQQSWNWTILLLVPLRMKSSSWKGPNMKGTTVWDQLPLCVTSMLLMLSFSHKQYENPIKWKVMAQIWTGCL